MANPTYQSGFYAPGRGTAKYPALWDGCVGAWNPGLGNTGLVLRDWSGRGSHGTLTNGPTWGVSDGRQALTFDGVNDRVVTGSILGFSGISQPALSFSAWVKMGASDYASLFKSGLSSGLQVYTATGGLGGGMQVSIGTTYPAYSNGGYLTANVWNHVAISYTGATIYFFQNGNAVGSWAVAANPILTTCSLGGYLNNSETLDGQAGDWRLYDRALSSNEIRLLAQRPGIAYERAPRKFYSLPAAASSRQYRLFRPAILRGA
jgi:hypothetical protein